MRTPWRALETATDGVHLVVCDLVLPQMSGETLGKAIGLRWPTLPILYVSGFPDADRVEEGMMPALSAVPEELAARVRAVLERR